MQDEYRLTPGMNSRKLQVVSFVKQYISRWGQWPSYGEIGGVMGIHPSTARDAVKRAVKDGLLNREPGSRKGVVRTPTAPSRLCPNEAAQMIERLREAGVIVMDTKASSATPTYYSLPISPPFRHLPDIE
ncbi:MAG: hypothetical protein EOO77_17190 [Oxalobacteraceae bacterium]|nr:MAG: hypothetical protein EOO77_17190 [Oxalobacteraceae bacterium]